MTTSKLLRPAALRTGRYVLAIAALVVTTALGLGVLRAQQLPSADDLEEESEQQSDEDREQSEQESSENQRTQGSEARPRSGEQAGETAAPPTSGDPSTSEGEAASGEQTQTAAGEEESGEAKQSEEKSEEDKPGEIVNTETNVEREVEGRGSTAGDPRWVQSGLNAHGVPGFQHIASAKARPANTYDIGFFGSMSSGRNMLRYKDTNRYAAGRLSVHGQPHKNFSANLSLEASNNVNSIGRPQAMLSQGDLTAGLRGHYAVEKFFHLGGDLSLLFPTGFSSAGIDFAGTTVTPRLLGTLEVNPLVEGSQVPLTAHLNLGYRVDNTSNTVPPGVELTRIERFAHNISAYDYVELGVGAEYDVPYVSPFAAWNLQMPVNGPDGICERVQSLGCVNEFGLAAFPNTASLGLRGEPVEQLALHAGVDISLTGRQAAGIPATAPYKIILGAAWNVDPRKRVERVTKTIEKTREVRKGSEKGYIDGTVVDKKTGEPIGDAKITYLQTDRASQMSDEEDGTFQSYRFEPGRELTVQISHPDYHSREITGTIQRDPEATKFELKPKPKNATVTGTVTDTQGSPISGATVRFGGGPEPKEVTTDSSGTFEAELKAGSYDVGVTSPKHRAATDSISVEAGGSSSLQFSLEEGGDSSLVDVTDQKLKVTQRVSFASATANISPDSKATLDQVATTLKAHPEIQKVEVQGHTDDVGNEQANMKLSEKRAKAVVDYLVKQGISRSRLVPEGYGPTQPKVPNISDRNRRVNRRVEFKILE